MKLALRWLLVLFGIIAVLGIIFSLYSNFVIDYSLNNLEYALSVADRAPAIESPMAKKVYRELVSDMSIDETGRENPEIKNLVLLDAASVSISEAMERAGYQRAGVYLSEIVESKLFNRHVLLKWGDQIYRVAHRFSRRLLALKNYVLTTLGFKKQPRRQIDYSSVLLLTKAEEQEGLGRYREAGEYYRKYLKYYPWNPDRGFVLISLAYTHIRIHDYNGAQKILKQVLSELPGREEASIAEKLLKRISVIKDRKILIGQLQRAVAAREGTAESEIFKLKLALAHLSIYDYDQAEEILKDLKKSEDPRIGQKAVFYLAWLYKALEQYDVSATNFSDLLSRPGVHPELELGSRAELASLYYVQKEAQTAAGEYEELVVRTENHLSSLDVAQKAWRSLEESQRTQFYKSWKSVGELEQANINMFDLGNVSQAENHLERLQPVAPKLVSFQGLRQDILNASSVSLRDRAFDALRKGRVHSAFEMFQRNADLFPRDGWTLSGLGTVYLLLAEAELAEKYTAQGYRFKSDEYTASAFAYVKSFRQDPDSAVGLYNEALQRDKGYLPARYNLACVYLELKDYEKALEIFGDLHRQLSSRHKYLKAKILNNMGVALWGLGEEDSARAHFRQAKAASPNFFLADMNLKLINEGQEPGMVHDTDP
ncbi:tetratricopeptide repeat protein [Omnitrophica bacterium]|nr:tetratricopeptide repeat protein [Candidatus Omnitrophota bacterium]